MQLKKKVIPAVRRAFPDGRGKLQSDLVPCLSSEKVRTIFRKHKLIVLDKLENRQILTPLRIYDQQQNLGFITPITPP